MLEKNVFYTVSFPSAVGCLSRMPWSWVPGVSFARVHEDIPLDLQSRAESKRVRQREAERERDPHSLRHPCPPRTHTCTHARTHPLQCASRRTSPWNQRKSAPSGCFCAARKGRRLKPHSFLPGCPEPGLALPWPPVTDRPTWKKHMHQSPGNPAVTLMTRL